VSRSLREGGQANLAFVNTVLAMSMIELT